MIKNELEKIKKIVQEFFDKTGFKLEIKSVVLEDDIVFIKGKTDEPKTLIGRNGWTLLDIQRLLRTILRKKLSEQIRLDIDINDYKKKKIDYLKETAYSAADEVSLTKKEKTLQPMSAYERRIIHLELSKRDDVKTESIGEDSERRIVIKPSS